MYLLTMGTLIIKEQGDDVWGIRRPDHRDIVVIDEVRKKKFILTKFTYYLLNKYEKTP